MKLFSDFMLVNSEYSIYPNSSMEDCVVKVEILIIDDSIPELRESIYVDLESVDPLVSIATNRRSYVHIDIEDNDSELSDL